MREQKNEAEKKKNLGLWMEYWTGYLLALRQTQLGCLRKQNY